jgi:hypothetical protein
MRQTLRKHPHFFKYSHYLYTEDALFADVYFNSIRAAEHHRAVPPAWQIAFDTARSGQVNAGQDMLLGINAHVQRDLPYVLARVGLRTPRGRSRKPDHDRINRVLALAFDPVVRAVARRYDPLVNALGGRGQKAAALGLLRTWRERAWRNARRLVRARGRAERHRVKISIGSAAAASAQAIAAARPPGYGARRDAYCRGATA